MNPTRAHLGRKQRAVINDLLNGINRYESLERNNIRPFRYREWLNNKLFRQELVARIDAQMRQAKYVMVHHYPQAAEKLSELINSEKPETARKACVEIIALHKFNDEQQNQNDKTQEQPKISDEKAERMLAILAEPEKPAPAQEPTAN